MPASTNTFYFFLIFITFHPSIIIPVVDRQHLVFFSFLWVKIVFNRSFLFIYSQLAINQFSTKASVFCRYLWTSEGILDYSWGMENIFHILLLMWELFMVELFCALTEKKKRIFIIHIILQLLFAYELLSERKPFKNHQLKNEKKYTSL